MKVQLNLGDGQQMAQIALTKAGEIQGLSALLEHEATVEGNIGTRDRVLVAIANTQALILLELASLQMGRDKLIRPGFPSGLVIPRNGG
jgi:hypothetical protein